MYFKRIAVSALVVGATLTGCAQTSKPSDSDHTADGLTIQSGGQPGQERGYFVVFDKGDAKDVRITEIVRSRPVLSDWETKEVLHVNQGMNRVRPDWRTYFDYDEKQDVFRCMTGLLRTDQDNKRDNYNPCDSMLTKKTITGKDVAGTGFLTVFSLGLGAVTGTSIYSVSIDEEAVADLIENTRMFDQIVGMLPQFAAQDEEIARTAAAQAARDKQLAEERRQAQLRQQQHEADERAKREREYDQWRRTLTIGSPTFCGLVIDRKPPLVKIAVNAPLQGYASEQWLNVRDVYPANLGCHHVNGRLNPRHRP